MTEQEIEDYCFYSDLPSVKAYEPKINTQLPEIAQDAEPGLNAIPIVQQGMEINKAKAN